MLYTVKNDKLSLTVSDMGAEMHRACLPATARSSFGRATLPTGRAMPTLCFPSAVA